jgi:Holliday junction resolvase RusA-like endonuclease
MNPANSNDLVNVSLVYRGDPVPKPRMTKSDKWKQRPVVLKYWAFKDAFILDARLAGFKSDMTPLMLEVIAYIAMPNSWSKQKKLDHAGQPHTTRPGPDADNILKAVADSLVAEDVTIYRKTIEKRWDDGNGPRLEVKITAVQNDSMVL